MNKAIQLAIEKGGFVIKPYHKQEDAISLDPLFWQALGKALGWNKKMVIRRGTVIGHFATDNPNIRFYGEEMGFDMDYFDPWLYYAHQYLQCKLTGGDEEKFLKELLK